MSVRTVPSVGKDRKQRKTTQRTGSAKSHSHQSSAEAVSSDEDSARQKESLTQTLVNLEEQTNDTKQLAADKTAKDQSRTVKPTADCDTGGQKQEQNNVQTTLLVGQSSGA